MLVSSAVAGRVEQADGSLGQHRGASLGVYWYFRVYAEASLTLAFFPATSHWGICRLRFCALLPDPLSRLGFFFLQCLRLPANLFLKGPIARCLQQKP